MRKLLITTIIALGAFTASAQTTKPKQEVKPADSIIHISIAPQQLKTIYGILGNINKSIEESDIPSKKAKEIREQMQGLAQFLGTTQVKKEK